MFTKNNRIPYRQVTTESPRSPVRFSFGSRWLLVRSSFGLRSSLVRYSLVYRRPNERRTKTERGPNEEQAKDERKSNERRSRNQRETIENSTKCHRHGWQHTLLQPQTSKMPFASNLPRQNPAFSVHTEYFHGE